MPCPSGGGFNRLLSLQGGESGGAGGHLEHTLLRADWRLRRRAFAADSTSTNDRAASRYFVTDEFRRNKFGDGGAEGFTGSH